MTMKNFENPKFILKCGQIPKDYLLHFFSSWEGIQGFRAKYK